MHPVRYLGRTLGLGITQGVTQRWERLIYEHVAALNEVLAVPPPIPAGIRSFRWNSGGIQWNGI